MLAALAGVRVHVATYKDYYQIMGVAREASQDEIKRAYRRLARKFHPDVSKEANAEDKFKELQEAYEVLKDPQRRAAYDQLGSNWRAGQEFRPPPDWGRDFEFSTSSFGGGGGSVIVMATSAISSPRCSGSAARSANEAGHLVAAKVAVAAVAASRRPATITSPRSRSTWKTHSAAARKRSSSRRRSSARTVT